MRYRIIVIFILTLTIGLYAEKIETPTKPISFNGLEQFSASEIESAVGIDNKSFYQFWKSDDPRIKVSLIPTLGEALKSFYSSEGFYDTTFMIKESPDHISVSVEENSPVTIKDINISSDFDISELPTLYAGERFRTEEFIRSRNYIIEALLKKGYCSYDLDSKAYVDLEKYSVDIVYKLKKGGICSFGKVMIDGLETIDESVAHSRVRAREGEVYSPQLVKDTYENFYSLDSYDSVMINTDRKLYNVVPVDINVTEISKPYHLELGLGFDSYVGLRVQSKIIRKNFMGNAQKLSLKAAWSQEEQLLESTFFRPALFSFIDYDIDFGVRGGYSNLMFEGFKEEKAYLRTYLEYNYARLKLRAGLALENIDIISHEAQPIKAITEGNFLLIYPYFNLVYDARDSKLNPKNGYYLSAYLEYGLANTEEASAYTKGILEGRFIYTFNKLTLATVGKIGAIELSEGNLPESKLFFAGGSYSNRAYGYNEMGVVLSPQENTIYGASSWVNLMFEANYPIWGDVYGAVFTDNTMLNKESLDFSGDFITSVGVGVRYMTPIGPFKLDFGVNVQDPTQNRVLFQIGHSF